MPDPRGRRLSTLAHLTELSTPPRGAAAPLAFSPKTNAKTTMSGHIDVVFVGIKALRCLDFEATHPAFGTLAGVVIAIDHDDEDARNEDE